MPRTNINATSPSKTGTTMPSPTAADVANGNSIINDGRLIVIATNSGASPRSVTVTPTATVDGLAAAARTTALPASTSVLLGPWEVSNYGTALQISGDNATDVKFQPIRFPG